ncbi:geranylgeranyl pyrophosphate synthetase [Colletotrichum scovillei]|nr:geranylgeranyl pyrophosphate synthetase [Colletotrichum scovillei]
MDSRVIHCVKHPVEPSDSMVSSATGCELVCSYNWKASQDLKIHVPGFAAVLQQVSLPITVPEDQATRSMNDSTARIPECSFEPLFRATASMNPSFRFDKVDILVNRNSLRKLLDFCQAGRQDSFRINLYLVHRNLIIERCEKTVSKLKFWVGPEFRAHPHSIPVGLEDSTAHHRALRYQLRDLTCVVRFEVDACYERKVEEGGTSQSLARAMSRLQTDDSQGRNASASQQPTQRVPMAQANAAEVKTTARRKSPGA